MNRFDKYRGKGSNLPVPSGTSSTPPTKEERERILGLPNQRGKRSSTIDELLKTDFDFAICLDGTGSMSSLIENAKASIAAIVDRVTQHAQAKIRLRVIRASSANYIIVGGTYRKLRLRDRKMGLFNWFSPRNRARCSKCGRSGKPLMQGGGGPKVFMGSPEEMRRMIFKCYGCQTLLCGACAETEMFGMSMFKCTKCNDDMGPLDVG